MMRKTPATMFIAAVLGLFAAGAAFGMDDASAIPTAFGIQDWFSSASAKWQISFPYETRFANPGISAGTAGNVESELDFGRIDSPVVIVTAGAMITPLISFDVAYGTGSIAGGRGRDTDRFVPNGGNGTDTTFFADGSTAASNLDWVSVTRQGAYAGMLFRF